MLSKRMLAGGLLLACVLTLPACGSLFQTPEQKAAEEARVEALVERRLDLRKFRIDITRMNPRRGMSRNVDYYYSITVNRDRVISHLPYFGVAYNLPYGGGQGLTFEADIDDYVQYQGTDRCVIDFTTHNDEDAFLYHLEIFPNGRTSVRVNSQNRESIDYQGELNPDFDPDKPEEG